jgi:hypothetical protein
MSIAASILRDIARKQATIAQSDYHAPLMNPDDGAGVQDLEGQEMSTEKIKAARGVYDNASWALYDAPVWGRLKSAAAREAARRALLALDPGHFARRERVSFEASTRKLLTPEAAEKRIAEYATSDVAKDLDKIASMKKDVD